MSEWPKSKLCEDLRALAKLRYTVLKGSKPQPLDHLLDTAPTLASVIPSVLLPSDPEPGDRVLAAKQLLERVAFSAESDEVKAAGDLLGFTDLSEEDMRLVFERHKEEKPSDNLRKFNRYWRETRLVLALRHEGKTSQWFVKKPRKLDEQPTEERWLTCFVDELCTYLDDEDGKLTKLAQDLGYIKKSKDKLADNYLRLSPSREAMDEDTAKRVVQDAFVEADEADVYRLALSLNFDPPLVCAACDYLKEENISIMKACDIIAADAGVFLDSLARRKEQPAVTRQIRQKVEGLESEHPRAVRALDFIAFLHHEYIAAEYVMAYLLECQYIDLDKFQHADLVYEEAMLPLIDAGLIEHNGAFARMNPLIHSVVRELRRDRCSEINDQLQRIGFMRPSDAPSAGQLMEAKWSPMSIASRWVLEFVLATRIHDQLENNRRLERAGRFAGANWLLIVAALRERFLYRATFAWVSHELGRYLTEVIDTVRSGGGSFIDLFESNSTEFSKFHDRIDFIEINPLLEDVLPIFNEVTDGFPSPQEDVLPVIKLYLERAFVRISAGEEARFRRDEVLTPLGHLRFSDYFPFWEKPQQAVSGTLQDNSLQMGREQPLTIEAQDK